MSGDMVQRGFSSQQLTTFCNSSSKGFDGFCRDCSHPPHTHTVYMHVGKNLIHLSLNKKSMETVVHLTGSSPWFYTYIPKQKLP